MSTRAIVLAGHSTGCGHDPIRWSVVLGRRAASAAQCCEPVGSPLVRFPEGCQGPGRRQTAGAFQAVPQWIRIPCAASDLPDLNWIAPFISQRLATMTSRISAIIERTWSAALSWTH